MHRDAQHDECCEERPGDHRPPHRKQSGDEKCGCQSHSAPVDLFASDAVPDLTRLHVFCLLTGAAPSGSIEFHQIEFEHRYRPLDLASARMVRAESLYARHCQMMI